MYEPGEFFEEIHTDENGVRYDGRGNRLSIPDQSFDRNAVCYHLSHGQRVRYADVYPGPLNVHQNQALSDFAVRFELESGLFMAPTIAPVKTVNKRSDIFYKVASQGEDIARNVTDNTDVRGVGSVANEVQQGFQTDTYTAEDRAVRDFVPDKVADNADEVLELMSSTTRFLEQFMLYRWDARVLALLTAANFTQTGTWTALGGGKVGSATEANRYIHLGMNAQNIELIRNNLMGGGTHIVINADVAQRMAASPEIAGQVKFVNPTFTQQGGWAGSNFGLPDLLNGKRVVVVPHVQNTAKKGQTANFSDLFTDNAMMMFVEAPGRKTRNAITTFRVGGISVRTYRDEPRKGTYVEVEMDQTEKITNAFGGHLGTDLL